MPTFKELTNCENKFMFRGKIYIFSSYIPIPSIHMVSEDGEKFSFGVTAPIADEFILITTTRSPGAAFRAPVHRPRYEV